MGETNFKQFKKQFYSNGAAAMTLVKFGFLHQENNHLDGMIIDRTWEYGKFAT